MLSTHQPPTDLLILGGSGFIGARLALAAQSAGLTAACTYRSRAVPMGVPAYALDLTDRAALADCLSETRPRAVVHCAVTYNAAGDTPEMGEAAQMRVSAESVRALIDALRTTGLSSRIVYISTNAVFSGKHGPYRETDWPDSEDRQDKYRFYGLGRRAGEMITLNEWPNSIVARTANVDGYDAWGQPNPRLFSMLNALRDGQTLTRYTDRTITPTLVDSVIDAILEITRLDFPMPESTGRVLHLTGREPVTDYDYARRIACRLGLPEERIQPDHYLPAGSTGRYNIALDVTQTQALLRTRMLNVDEMLDKILGRPDGQDSLPGVSLHG